MKSFCLAAATACSATLAHAQASKPFPLVDGVSVDLAAGWDAKTMTNPAMSFKEFRDQLSDAREIRLANEHTLILVSTQSWKPIQGKSLDFFDTAENAQKGAKLMYLSQAVEAEAKAETRINGNVRTALVTLHARPGQTFNVRAGAPGGCVSTGNVRKGWTVMAVSIASDSCASDTHKAAVAAFLAAHE